MQIVIELTDEQWKCVQDGTWCGTKEILNGTPLPKGHGRLIDESKVTRIFRWDNGNIDCDAPTILEADGGMVNESDD